MLRMAHRSLAREVQECYLRRVYPSPGFGRGQCPMLISSGRCLAQLGAVLVRFGDEGHLCLCSTCCMPSLLSSGTASLLGRVCAPHGASLLGEGRPGMLSEEGIPLPRLGQGPVTNAHLHLPVPGAVGGCVSAIWG